MKNNGNTMVRLIKPLSICISILCFLALTGCSTSPIIKKNELLILNNQLNKAIQNYRAATIQNPENHEFIYYLAKALYLNNELNSAYLEISKAIFLEPQLDEYRLLAGKIAYDKVDYFNATNQLINCLLLNDSNLEAYYLLAQTYQKTEKLSDAIAQLETATSLEPMFFDAQYLLYSLKFQEAINKKVEKEKEQSSETSLIVGSDLENDIKDFITKFRKAINYDPKTVKGVILLSEMYNFIGESKMAQAVLMNRLEQFDDNPEEIVVKLARLKYQNGLFEEAYEILKKIENPDLDTIALTLRIEKKVDPNPNINIRLNSLLKKNPNSLDLILLAGQEVFEKGDLIEAEKLIQRCININPEFTDCYLMLSAILSAQKDLFGSKWAFEKAFELSPANAELRIKYANYLISNLQYEEAENILDHPSLDKSDPKVALAKAKIAKEKEDYEDAIEFLNIARKYAYDVEIETELADIEIRRGKFSDAERRLEKVQSIVKDHLEVDLQKAKLYSATRQYNFINQILEKHLLTESGNGRVHILLAENYARNGNLKRANEILEQGIKIWPRHLELTNILTFYLGLEGKYVKAIAFLNDIQAFDHKYNNLFYQRLLSFYYKSGKIDEYKKLHR